MPNKAKQTLYKNTARGNDMETITVKNMGRDLEINKEDFVKRWTDTHGDVWYLADNREDMIKVKKMTTMLKHLAEKKFDALFAEKEQAA